MQKQVIIDCFPESVLKYPEDYAVVAVDVIRATTSAITIAARGGHCFPVPSLEAALELKGKLKAPLLAGEIGGTIAPGFELNNSPAQLDKCDLTGRPVILLSSSGTRLISLAEGRDAVHLACFRNYGYVARHVGDRHSRVAVIGAGSRGEFRLEDQMCCAWIARDLAEMGYGPADEATLSLIKNWATEHPEAALKSKSADFLRRSGQTQDLGFILSHINDLRGSYEMRNGEVVALPAYENGLVVAAPTFIDSSPRTYNRW
ncbi:MAG TPA: 2-phosphosulfolactate phosphatase [Terriglobia bacterium]|nr:2-phosphosulfolactate phosphatase [Terriglobia bacterium]